MSRGLAIRACQSREPKRAFPARRAKRPLTRTAVLSSEASPEPRSLPMADRRRFVRRLGTCGVKGAGLAVAPLYCSNKSLLGEFLRIISNYRRIRRLA